MSAPYSEDPCCKVVQAYKGGERSIWVLARLYLCSKVEARRAAKRQDIRPLQMPELQWDPDNRQQSLTCIYKRAEEHAVNAINWYLASRRSKKRWAQWLRLGAIFFTAVAGILPILSQIFMTSRCSLLTEPAWASVALGLAALLVGIDRFFGYSTAWMRFISTEHQIRQILHEFQIDVEAEQALWEGKPPNPEQLQKALSRCRAFLIQVDELIRKETDQWLAEFQNTLRQVDEAAQAKAAITEDGGVSATVTNGDQIPRG